MSKKDSITLTPEELEETKDDHTFKVVTRLELKYIRTTLDAFNSTKDDVTRLKTNMAVCMSLIILIIGAIIKNWK